MASTIDKLISKNLISPPPFLKNNVQYEAITGSVAYGCSDDWSDMDIVGWCFPPKDVIFPHLSGVIFGFDNKYQKFDQYQQHHILDESNGKNHDITIYNIVKFFRWVADNNPNMVDSLFVPRRCILHITKIGEMVRDNKKIFLNKRSWHTFKGYAYSQLSKMKNKTINEFVKICKDNDIPYDITEEGIKNMPGVHTSYREHLIDLIRKIDSDGKRTKRVESIAKYGMDVKFAYHIVRLMNEIEQILEEGDLDLERNREQLKSIRRGEWTLERIEEYFQRKEKVLEELYHKSKLPYSPDETAIKELLMNCLEEHFGNLSSAVVKKDFMLKALRDIHEIAYNTLKRTN